MLVGTFDFLGLIASFTQIIVTVRRLLASPVVLFAIVSAVVTEPWLNFFQFLHIRLFFADVDILTVGDVIVVIFDTFFANIIIAEPTTNKVFISIVAYIADSASEVCIFNSLRISQ